MQVRAQILNFFREYLALTLEKKRMVINEKANMTHSQMLGKFEYTGGPIFKVVLEC